MIPITKDFDTKPDKLCYDRPKMLNLLDDLKLKGNNHKFKPYRYRDCCIEELKVLYKRKCGYCETNTEAGAELRVDHYRPKDGIFGEVHSGYFWLGYEWSNLILACEKCNRAKSNQFPISLMGNRIISPPVDAVTNSFKLERFVISHDDYINEQALIVNPETDLDLLDWFIFTPSGKILGTNDKARTTIDICDLNRESLLISRKKLIFSYQSKVRKFLMEYISSGDAHVFKSKMKDIFDEIAVLKKERNVYSRLGYFIFIKFDLFIVSVMKEKCRPALRLLYQKYLNNTY